MLASCSEECSVLVSVFRRGKRLGTGRRAIVEEGVVRVSFNFDGKVALRRRRLRVNVGGLASFADGRMSAPAEAQGTIRRKRRR